MVNVSVTNKTGLRAAYETGEGSVWSVIVSAPPGTLACQWLSGEEDAPSLLLGVSQLFGGLDRT